MKTRAAVVAAVLWVGIEGVWAQDASAPAPQATVLGMFGEKTSRGAVRALLRSIGERTGTPPNFLGGMTSSDGRRTEAFCGFSVNGKACKALILCDAEAGRTILFTDRAETFDRNYADLSRSFLDSNAPPDAPWKLERRTLSDGSTIDLPATWRITGDNRGMISAKGPEGSIDYGCATQVYATSYRRTAAGRLARGVLFADVGTPSQVHQELFPQVAALAQQMGEPPSRFLRIVDKADARNRAGAGEVVDYEWDSFPDGRPVRWRSVALVITAPLADGQVYYLSAVHAPAQNFSRRLRELLRIWASCTVSEKTQGERLNQAAASLKHVGEIIRGVNETRTKAFEDSLKNWSAAFREETFARDRQTGAVSPGQVSGGYDLQRVLDAANQGAGWKRFELLNPKDIQ